MEKETGGSHGLYPGGGKKGPFRSYRTLVIKRGRREGGEESCTLAPDLKNHQER